MTSSVDNGAPQSNAAEPDRIGVSVIAAVAAIFLLTTSLAAYAESVYVKYSGNVDLAPFNCTTVTRSSFIQRVCYDKREQYLLLSLSGTYYHYCEIDAGTVSKLFDANSMGQYYNQTIKGHFDCRVNRVSRY